MVHNPENDGVDHINVYSKAKTNLGRWLSNFALQPITTEDGPFDSIEGYWYWLNCNHKEKDKLRAVSGWEAKQLGRRLGAKDWNHTDLFKNKIRKAISIKLSCDKKLLDELKKSVLPLAHYYVYGDKVVEVKEAQWILDHIDSIRRS